eukprot:2029790-Alexandrium_andersonii.AAC.1
MSASLVGSEMCIRDRKTLSTVADVEARAYAEHGLPMIGLGCHKVEPWWCCLLYTSDAADDM